MPRPIMSLEGVSKVFNPGTQDETLALDHLDLEVHEGDFITIIGSNGAGKTTLLNVIAGTFPLDTGRLMICDRDVTKSSEHAWPVIWPGFSRTRPPAPRPT